MKTLYYNGQVYTGRLPLTEAFVVEHDRFLFAGSLDEAEKMAGADVRRTDLGGRFVCSGFHDSHMHLLNYGYTLGAAQLGGFESLEGMLRYLEQFVMQHSDGEGQWILGRGWNQDDYKDVSRMPDRHDLDRISTEIPICIVRCCGHCLVANSRALELAGITGDTLQPEGGRIGTECARPHKDSSQQTGGSYLVPNGRLFDNAMNLIYRVMPVPSKDDLKRMILTACKALNSYGITSCQTDDYCVFRQVPWQLVNEAYRELEEAGELTVRIYEQCNFTSPDQLREFVHAGRLTGTGSSMFRIGPLKMLGDGSLGSRTAFLSRSYADDPSTCGFPVFSQEVLEDMIAYAHAAGMQTATHAIGDACLDQVLLALEKALAAYPRKDHRHGVVHCQITRLEQLTKIRDLNLHVYAQSIFLDYDSRIVEDRVGRELAATSYNWKTLMEMGVSVSNGSDCPVEPPNVLAGIQCAVSSTYLPDQAFTVQEALDSYTIKGAFASFEEQIKGQIRPGMLADFVILDKNPFDVPACEIRDISVCATYLGGRKVFSCNSSGDV